jgi:hypothetical protein
VKVNQALEALRQRQEAGEAEIRASVGLQPASCCCCMCRGSRRIFPVLQFCNQCSPRNTIICTACCLLFVYLPACFLSRDQPKVTCASLAYLVLSLSFLRFLPLLLPMLAL